MKLTDNNFKSQDKIKGTNLIPITLEQMSKISGGTPVVPDVIIRPIKTVPPPP